MKTAFKVLIVVLIVASLLSGCKKYEWNGQSYAPVEKESSAKK